MQTTSLPPRVSSRNVILLLWLLIWISVSGRWVFEFVEEGHPSIPLLVGILLAFGVLMTAESLAPRRVRWRTHVYLFIQAVLVGAAMLLYYELDFFALLYLPLASQAVMGLPQREARIWLGILVLGTVVGQIVQFGWPGAFPFMSLYIAGLLFVALFSENTVRSEIARRRSEKLLEELGQAHAQLQELAGQAEALAVAEERNRLARELHDSVAQTLYGLTLRSEAALRQLAAGRTEKIGTYLQEFRDSTLQSLGETRLLIHELRPQILAEQGLAEALAQRLENVEKRSGMTVALEAETLPEMTTEVETALYRIAQEALNNVLKHARAKRVTVVLQEVDGEVRLRIVDDGAGPGPETPGGVGIASMRERAQAIGASFSIEAGEAGGTVVAVGVPVSLQAGASGEPVAYGRVPGEER